MQAPLIDRATFADRCFRKMCRGTVERYMQNIETIRNHSRGCRNTQWSLTPKAFAKFLSWLAPDWEEAGRKYEQIRAKMLRFFARRGCHIPEELFDRTIDRICGKIEVEAIVSIGDVLAFCYAVGRFVALEYWREMKSAPLPENVVLPEIKECENDEHKFEWLERRLNGLSPRDRHLITAYYQGEGRERIRKRKALASEVGGVNALRIKLCRVRARLRDSEAFNADAA
jgi:hypothetical protein